MFKSHAGIIKFRDLKQNFREDDSGQREDIESLLIHLLASQLLHVLFHQQARFDDLKTTYSKSFLVSFDNDKVASQRIKIIHEWEIRMESLI